MTIEIRPAGKEEIRSFYGYTRPEIREAFGAFLDGRTIGISGIIKDPRYFGSLLEEEGRWIGFLNVIENPPGFGPRAVRAIVAYLKTIGDPVYVQCDDYHPSAERLLRVLGFAPTTEFMPHDQHPERNLRIWKKWQR